MISDHPSRPSPGSSRERVVLASRICDMAREWRRARRARAETLPGSHAWANAEMVVRFWSQEFRELRQQARTIDAREPDVARR